MLIFNDFARPSEDDALEQATRPDDMFIPAIDEEKLPDDYDPPATPASSRYDATLKTHPITDDLFDRDELYHEGLGEATNYSDTLYDSDDTPARPLEPE